MNSVQPSSQASPQALPGIIRDLDLEARVPLFTTQIVCELLLTTPPQPAGTAVLSRYQNPSPYDPHYLLNFSTCVFDPLSLQPMVFHQTIAYNPAEGNFRCLASNTQMDLVTDGPSWPSLTSLLDSYKESLLSNELISKINLRYIEIENPLCYEKQPTEDLMARLAQAPARTFVILDPVDAQGHHVCYSTGKNQRLDFFYLTVSNVGTLIAKHKEQIREYLCLSEMISRLGLNLSLSQWEDRMLHQKATSNQWLEYVSNDPELSQNLCQSIDEEEYQEVLRKEFPEERRVAFNPFESDCRENELYRNRASSSSATSTNRSTKL